MGRKRGKHSRAKGRRGEKAPVKQGGIDREYTVEGGREDRKERQRER